MSRLHQPGLRRPVRWASLLRLEVTTLALLPCAGVGAEGGFAQVEPTLHIDGGTEFVGAAELRWSFLGGRLSAMGQGGTLPLPMEEGMLRPGVDNANAR